MIEMQSLLLVLRYVIRQPRRSILTMLTFAVATFIFTTLAAIPGSIDMILKKTSETLRLYSYNADGRYLGVPARDCRTIEKIPGVVACNPMVVLRATYQNASETVQAFALDADKVALMYPDYNLSAQVLEQFSKNRDAAVAGRLLMRKHGWKVGDVVALRGDSNRLDIKFTLVGEIPADNYPNFFMFRRDYLVEAEKAIGIAEEKHPAGFLVTRVDTAVHVPSVIHEIDGAFHNSDYETASMTESEAVSGLMSTVGDIRGIVYAVSIVIGLTIFLIAANSMSMMVRERLRDVAVLRALGFSPAYIARLLLGECAVIGSVGGALGCALALWQFGSGTTLRAVLESAGYLTVSLDAALEALLAAAAISVLSAAIPVLGAMRVTPADAFRKTI
jgi:putative ABC transport system permease protein